MLDFRRFSDHFGKFGKERSSELFRSTLNQTTAELSTLPTDFGLRLIGQHGFTIDFGQGDISATLSMTCRTAIALTCQRKRIRCP